MDTLLLDDKIPQNIHYTAAAPGDLVLQEGEYDCGGDKHKVVFCDTLNNACCLVSPCLYLHIGWTVGNGHISTTFMLDTGAPFYIYLCPATQNVFLENGLMWRNIDMDEWCVCIDGRPVKVSDSPRCPSETDTNTMGILLLQRFEFCCCIKGGYFRQLPDTRFGI